MVQMAHSTPKGVQQQGGCGSGPPDVQWFDGDHKSNVETGLDGAADAAPDFRDQGVGLHKWVAQ